MLAAACQLGASKAFPQARAEYRGTVFERLLSKIRIFHRIDRLERHMSEAQDAIAEQDTAIVALGQRIDAIVAADENIDSETADAIRAETAKLSGLAPAANPTPDAPDSPDA
jgi:chromosome condensin MukBEF complex kleisin-like MukF subunit